MEHAQRDEYNKLNGTKRVVLILILMEHAQRELQEKWKSYKFLRS